MAATAPPMNHGGHTTEVSMKGSWKTTAAGIVSGIAIIATQVSYLLDADPATVFSIEAVFAALGMIGIGFFARDNNVSSEKAGAN